MRVFYDLDLVNFKAWSGGEETLRALTHDQIRTLEQNLEYIFPEDCEETQINDFLWFERDEIAQILGYKSWEALERADEWGEEITVRIYGIEWDYDEEEYEEEFKGDCDEELDLPAEVIHTFEGCFEGADDEDLIEEISDWLSDEYGYCHDGLQVEEVEREEK